MDRQLILPILYAESSYAGNLLDLFEPGFGPAFAPNIIDNSRFPADWFDKSSALAASSADDPYYSRALDQVMVRVDEEQ